MNQIDVLPDDVLLRIFDFYVDVDMSPSDYIERQPKIEVWQSLVHVCRRWRSLVLASPRRLNLRLVCTPEKLTKSTLDIWPALLLIISGCRVSSGTDNIIAALGQSNRVCEVDLSFAGRELAKVLAPMQVPFLELTDLCLFSDDETPPIIPDSFLDGSAPRLQRFVLIGIPFPGLSNLLLSATHLVELKLIRIPHSGYISPEAMGALLSVLSSLESFCLQFPSPQSFPDLESRSQPPPKFSILPALVKFCFDGNTRYLEELVTSIDTPQLIDLCITFFNQIDFDCPRLAQFINRTPTLSAFDEAHVEFDDRTASVKLLPRTFSFDDGIRINISCGEPDLQLWSVGQVCNSFLPPPPAVEDLYIEHEYRRLLWENSAIENTLWLELLLPFTAVKNLYLSEAFAPDVAAALQELVGTRITEVLPSLQNIFVEELEPWGPFHEDIEQFAAARQLSNHPIGIFEWVEYITILLPSRPSVLDLF